MLILSLCQGRHDSSAVVADDYKILSAVSTERVTRKKGDGKGIHSPTVHAALQAANVNITDIESILLVAGGKVPACCFNWGFTDSLRYGVARAVGNQSRKDYRVYRDTFNKEKLLSYIGMKKTADVYFYNHHFAHALSALFFTDWKNALLYTADGGGDATNYSMYHFNSDSLEELYGDRDNFNRVQVPPDSIGKAYSLMTEALGYRSNRHEGKLTGLAAFGIPDIYDELAKCFWVDEMGRVQTNCSYRYKEMISLIAEVAKTTTPANAAASVQKLLEDIILKSIGIYLQRTGCRHIGLAGGCFANVALNRRIAELPSVDEVFVFPAMGDEGLAVGGVYQYLLQRDGLQTWQTKRQRLQNVYWGNGYDDSITKTFANKAKLLPGETAEVAAKLLAEDKIVALYVGRMEFGPRALGARSILAGPQKESINDTLNKRLQRTEFMPFAPFVLAEDADDIFDINDTNRYAMRFMTITCEVRPAWRERIPAVVHVDNTARPQIIYEEDNPLYAAILRKYKAITGLPVLVNTSFNAHEEPIIHTPEECLRALQNRRVDYVATAEGVYTI